MREWNPRYVAYARSQGREPQAQLDHDKALYPAGGCMIPFVWWGRDRLVEYSKINPGAFTCGDLTDHESYDAWLHKQICA